MIRTEYVHSGGARFSNVVLQTLRVLCKTPPPDPSKSLFIIATTSQRHHMGALGMGRGGAFDTELEMPQLTTAEHVEQVGMELMSVFVHVLSSWFLILCVFCGCSYWEQLITLIGEHRRSKAAAASPAEEGEDESKEPPSYDEFFDADTVKSLSKLLVPSDDSPTWCVKPLLRIIDGALHKDGDPATRLMEVLTLSSYN